MSDAAHPARTGAPPAAAVRMEGITKRFPLVLANDAVDFDVAWGEIHALIGENGAGKSTLMKILYGLQDPDAGHMTIDGAAYAPASARDAIARRIGMVHQHFMLVAPLSVTENVVLGSEPGHAAALDYAAARRTTRNLIDRFGFDIDPDEPVGDLPLGRQQQVEILKALYRDARILIMDEPTAVLTPQETRGLFRFLREYAAEGHAIVFISHKLDEVMEICDRMSVMRDGAMIGTVEREATDTAKLATMMVGREVLLRVDKVDADVRETRLAVHDLRLRHPDKPKDLLAGVDLDVRAGEILGVAGIEGNGQSELVECITGLRPPDAGTVTLLGEDVTDASARSRRHAGLSHVPEDRNARGLVGSYDAAMNAILGDHHDAPYAGPLGLLDLPRIREHARAIIAAYDVRPTSIGVLARAYSGGNAQKLIVARELERDPKVLVLAQPTRGVDIGAIEFIHRQIVRARDEGLAVLLVSADLNEVLSLSDRIVVMYEGALMGELDAADADPETLGLMMAGATVDAATADAA
ncbi:MAG: ABC transporter ATP-binding protein [Trueperaceae bacterium]|nr:ABC transporter ATP-binding protein [Trueperaceae bacterium]